MLAGSRTSGPAVLRNEEQLGLAASLNRGLDEAPGRYVARLDADDVALPRAARAPDRADRRDAGRRRRRHGIVDPRPRRDRPRGPCIVNPARARAVRWLALFSSPFFHPTVLVDRELLDRHGLRYDPAVPGERGLRPLDAAARVRRRRESRRAARPEARASAAGSLAARRLQESFQRQVALREIARSRRSWGQEAELAWRLGSRPGREAARGSGGGRLSQALLRGIRARGTASTATYARRRGERAPRAPACPPAGSPSGPYLSGPVLPW